MVSNSEISPQRKRKSKANSSQEEHPQETLSTLPPSPSSDKPRIGLFIETDDGKEEVLYIPTPKQIEFHARPEPNVLYIGARGTGKSHALRMEAHSRAMAYPGYKYIILRRTYPQLHQSHLQFIDREMRKLGGTWNVTNKTAKYKNGSIGFFSHCESEGDVLNLLSAEFFWMGFDEMSTFPWEMITKLAASVRVPPDSGLVAMVRGATNPLGESAGDLNRYYVLKDIEAEEDADYSPDDYYSVHTIMGDNPHVDVAQYRKRFAGFPEHVKRAWLDGEFLEERTLFRFKSFKDKKPWHVIEELPTTEDGKSILTLPWVKIYRAYDDGFFPDPAVCLWIAVVGKRIIVFKEMMWIEKTIPEIAKDIKEASKGMRITATYCDPKMDIKTSADIHTPRQKFGSAGVQMTSSINDREYFANAINQALTEIVDGLPRLQLYVDGKFVGVPMLRKFLPQMKWDENNPKKMADHRHDHLVVALAYFLMSYIPKAFPHEKQEMPPWMKKKSARKRLGSGSVRQR